MNIFTDFILTWPGLIVVGIFVLTSSLRTAIETWDLFVAPVKFLRNQKKDLIRNEIKSILESLRHVPIRDVSLFLEDGIHTHGLLDSKTAVSALSYHIKESVETGSYELDSRTTLKTKCFINLRRRYLTSYEHLKEIARAFASYIHGTCKDERIDYDIIISPTTSSSVLLWVTAQMLGKKLIFFDSKTDTKVNGMSWMTVGATTNESFVGMKAIIIDESFVNGGIIAQIYPLAIKNSFCCEHIFCIFQRGEGNVNTNAVFKDSNIKFHVSHSLSDIDLEEMSRG